MGRLAAVVLGWLGAASIIFSLCLLLRPVVEVIAIDGSIDSDTAARVALTVKRINDDQTVKAVVVIVNSPGGTVHASVDTYEELSKLKVPVVAWCDEGCMSGGYYVLMAPTVKWIGIRRATEIGSVGVIAKVSREPVAALEIYKSGKYKQASSDDHAPTDEERVYLQSIVDQQAQIFYDAIETARGAKISLAGWQEIKAARIFSGHYGVDVGLADQIMSREEVIEMAKQLSNSKMIFTRDTTK